MQIQIPLLFLTLNSYLFVNINTMACNEYVAFYLDRLTFVPVRVSMFNSRRETEKPLTSAGSPSGG